MRLLLASLLIAIASGCGGSDDNAESALIREPSDRSTTDRPDEESGSQVHLVYAIPSDGEDQQLDINGTIETSFTAAQAWLSGETNGRTLRLDTFAGAPDVSFLRLTRSDASLQSEGAFTRDAIEAEMRDAGFDSEDKIYAVYYDGGSTYACGSGAYPPTLPGNVAVLFLHGQPEGTKINCADNAITTDVNAPGFWEFVAVHEVLHTLGFVPECAPNEDLSGHIAGPANDLMYEGEEETDLPRTLDGGRDDYYESGIDGCLDLTDSPYLTE